MTKQQAHDAVLAVQTTIRTLRTYQQFDAWWNAMSPDTREELLLCLVRELLKEFEQ